MKQLHRKIQKKMAKEMRRMMSNYISCIWLHLRVKNNPLPSNERELFPRCLSLPDHVLMLANFRNNSSPKSKSVSRKHRMQHMTRSTRDFLVGKLKGEKHETTAS